MDLGLSGAVAAVAAASRGLGLACARALAAEGARVAICSRDAERIRAAAASLAASTGQAALPVVADVATADGYERFAAAVREAYGRCDILVLNSGGPPPGTFDSLSVDDFRAASELLLLSAVRGTKAFLPLLSASERGRIIVITSTSVREVLPNLMLSNSLRAAVTNWAKTLARELAPRGITVNCVAPGTIDTERIAELIAANARRQQTDAETVRRQLLARIPMGRFGRPEELAAAVAFLASRQASFITGITLTVDGAQTSAP
ncbi:MAG: SDR family oxidoreductase [Planctomycetota bacterium]|nr:SDR family oxidoreductase [Planctomycetota bacterium]MCX8040371.1 SDR family oxidoreductase [Planctomycetota bacterium]MDW8373747.1 SDR family oxidoreductase [Planctomycetota bacterium]